LLTLRTKPILGELTGDFCECGTRLVRVRDWDALETLCPSCGCVYDSEELPDGHEDDEIRFGRAPTHQAVLWNNLGTVPGREMRNQVTSALNQYSQYYVGQIFAVAQERLYRTWCGKESENAYRVKKIYSDMIESFETRTRRKIPEYQVAALGELVDKSLQLAEQTKRLTKQELVGLLETILTLQGFPP
jgi:hypothetical protein